MPKSFMYVNDQRDRDLASHGLLGANGDEARRQGKFDTFHNIVNAQYKDYVPSTEHQLDIEQMNREASVDPNELYQKSMMGVGDIGKQIGFDPTDAALSSRAKRSYERSMGELDRGAKMDAQTKSQSLLGRAQDYVQNVENIRRGMTEKMVDLEAQKEAARAQVIGQMYGSGLGALGMGLGSAFKGKTPEIKDPVK